MSGAAHGSLAPSAWVLQWAPGVPEGTVLDLACGGGRHARHFAALGHRVLAVDRDTAALASMAVLLYETFMLGNERYGKPSNPEFLLRAGELWDVFGVALQVRSFEQGYRAEPKPAIIQRLCAVRA